MLFFFSSVGRLGRDGGTEAGGGSDLDPAKSLNI